MRTVGPHGCHRARNEVTYRVESEAVIPPLFCAEASHTHTHTHTVRPSLAGSRAPDPPSPSYGEGVALCLTVSV
jgi:hypothetical protein